GQYQNEVLRYLALHGFQRLRRQGPECCEHRLALRLGAGEGLRRPGGPGHDEAWSSASSNILSMGRRARSLSAAGTSTRWDAAGRSSARRIRERSVAFM